MSLRTLALVFLLSGCGTVLGGAAKEAAPGAIQGAVEGIANPETQRKLIEGVDEERLRVLTERLSAGTVDGILTALEDPTRRARVDAILTGMAGRVVGGTMDTMFARALDPRTQRRMRLALRAAMSEVIASASDSVRAQLGSPEDRSAALGTLAHELTKQATLGFQSALDETKQARDTGAMAEEQGSLVAVADDASKKTNIVLWTLGLGLLVLGVGLAITLAWAVRRNRSRRLELAERDGAISLLAEAIQSAAEGGGSIDLQRIQQSSLDGGPHAEHVRRVLGARGVDLKDFDRGPPSPPNGVSRRGTPAPQSG